MADAARTAAFDSLLRIEKDGAYSNLVMNRFSSLSELDRAFATALLLGVIERTRALDLLIDRYAERPSEPGLRVLLRCGVYQLFFMDKVPQSAACNETVTLAVARFGAKKAGFVNAVLRALCRNKEEARASLASAPTEVRCSFAPALASMLRAQYPDRADAIMEAFCGKNPLRLRVNPLKTTPEALAERFGGTFEGTMLTVEDGQSEILRHADEGDFLVQGYGSQKAVALLDAKPGMTVIDVCACPGGKSFGAAMDMQNDGIIYSMDIHENKLPLIEKGAKKLGISIIHTAASDARTPVPAWIGKADRVICDVPCSGLGVIGSKPEVRYKNPTEFCGLYPTQKKILETAASYLKHGGVLVYSTCTWNKEENEAVIDAFMDSHGAEYTLAEEHTFLPDEEAGEGFFAARLERK